MPFSKSAFFSLSAPVRPSTQLTASPFQPFLPLPPPNQPRPTTFPPALCSLLSSPISHSTRPQTPSQLLKPPTLPERVDPKSEEARLIGPLTLQREKAIRKRYFRDQVAKIRAPIGVRIDGLGEGEVAEKEVLENAGVVGWKVGNTLLEILEEKLSGEGGPRATIPRRLLDRLEPKPTSTTGTNGTTTAATTSPSTPEKPKLSRTEKKLLVPRILSPSSKNTKWDLPKTVTSRLLRRIYQRILADSPVVSISIPSPTTPPKSPATLPNLKPRIAIVRSRFAKGGQAGIAVLSEEEAWWAEQGMGADENRRGQGRKGPTKPGK